MAGTELSAIALHNYFFTSSNIIHVIYLFNIFFWTKLQWAALHYWKLDGGKQDLDISQSKSSNPPHPSDLSPVKKKGMKTEHVKKIRNIYCDKNEASSYSERERDAWPRLQLK